MSRCCSRRAYADFFDEKLARRDYDRYRRKGLTGAAAAIADAVAERGIDGSSVLEIGGGVGSLHVELVDRGAARASNVELSPAYETVARELLADRGVADRVERHVGDVVERPDAVDPADVVVLNRVVCCYPDAEALLAVAAAKARRLVVFSYPPDHLLTRIVLASINAGFRFRGCDFRTYAHSERAMLSALERLGLRLVERSRAGVWRIALLAR